MGPALLIADEPTGPGRDGAGEHPAPPCACGRDGAALLLITHDLGIVAEVCDRVYVMYAARVVGTNAVEGSSPVPAPLHPGAAAGDAGGGGLRRGAVLGAGDGADRRPPAGCRFPPLSPGGRGLPGAGAAPLMARAEGGSDACWRALEPAAAPWDGLAAAGDEIELEIEAGGGGRRP